MTPGQTVTLRGTARRYTIKSIYSTYPFQRDLSQVWCTLRTEDDRPAYWLLSQLEPVPIEPNN